jgi:translation initiation factor 1 (eIF-1/SUI1)
MGRGGSLSSKDTDELFSVENILENLDKEQKRIKIRLEKRKFGKGVTIIEGLSEDVAIDLTKELKSKLACGGTYKNGNIELQGDHRDAVKQYLLSKGYLEENIIIE